jgi:hypothetical protein
VRNQRVKNSLIGFAASGIAAGALLLATASPASAHFTCKDGTTTTVDDPAIACEGHGGPATGAAPTTEAEGADHDHAAPEAPPTTKAATATTKAATTATTKPAAVAAKPAYTG